MYMVCPGCGQYSEEKVIDAGNSTAICPFCGYVHPFIRQDLFIITGASGTGKSAIGLELVRRLPECVVLESDILWRAEFASAADNYQGYRNTWLRMANNIGQNGRPVVLLGSAVPEQFESCPQRRYFKTIFYLALVCDAEILGGRLRRRPEWRKTGSNEFIQRMVDFNNWFKQNAANSQPPIDLVDTTHFTVAESTATVAEWVKAKTIVSDKI